MNCECTDKVLEYLKSKLDDPNSTERGNLCEKCAKAIEEIGYVTYEIESFEFSDCESDNLFIQ